ncbi:TupA-like ATPgrasp [Butyrivibrio proteoclasticus]|uniref:TupA-like ATPgrasp n=1 Tax=Butyrivibrio proteoclasticus TaxID=43305 RepID=A0A1I5X7N7_9FIRM|nr:ATP-grasp fold amidoligase family protein [Butyrivibrio proteoclasticus]SFQ27995.1 TupA-like ATPgrasp [Butyrivibrio proteoclasticus]
MDNGKNIINRITDKDNRFLLFESMGLYKHVNDEEIIKRLYEIKMGKVLNLDEPHTLSEKIQWLKLHDRNRLYYTLLDRYEVKKWVDKRIRSGHVIEDFGVWRTVDDVEYFKCPSNFVLKITHNPVGNFCFDKYSTDFKAMKRQMKKDFSKNLYWNGNSRDWAYQYVDRRIMAEEYIPEIWVKGAVEYRVTCFNGKAEIISIYIRTADNDSNIRACGYFDRDWNKLPFTIGDTAFEKGASEPDCLDDIIEYSEALARGIPFVVVNGYWIRDNYIFDGMSLYPDGGFTNFYPDEWDRILGDKLDLSAFDAKIINFPIEKIKKDG